MTTAPRHVTLRPLEAADASVFAAWSADELFCAHAEWTHESDPGEHEAFWDALITRPPKDLLRLAAEGEGELVGYVDLHGHSENSRELGFVVGPSSRWGQGWGSALARAGLDHGFTELGLQQVWAEAYQANQASIAILRGLKLGPFGDGDVGTFLGQPTRYERFVMKREDWRPSVN